MRFIPTPIPHLLLVELEPRFDSRGSFARAWCRDALREQGIDTECAQVSLSYNARRGTLRGMHYQLPPHSEDKFVRVLRGSIHDVVLDLREGSPTCGQWFGAELSASNGRAMFIPQGCAHGYITLTDDSELLYLVSTPYAAEHSAGVRWTCELLRGAWPAVPAVLSDRDAELPEVAAAIPGTWLNLSSRKAG